MNADDYDCHPEIRIGCWAHVPDLDLENVKAIQDAVSLWTDEMYEVRRHTVTGCWLVLCLDITDFLV